MKKFQSGEFEEIVLSTVSILENGYGVSIRKNRHALHHPYCNDKVHFPKRNESRSGTKK